MQNNSQYIAALIKKQQIRKEFVPTDLFTIDVTDKDYIGGRKPMVLEMGVLADIIGSGIEFIDLADTPKDYTGFAGYSIVVNQAEDGLEFIAPVIEEGKYEARVDFDGALDPTDSVILESALGVTVTLSRTALGTYRATLGAVVDQSKLIAWLGTTTLGTLVPTVYSTTFIEFEHHAFAGGLIDATQDGVSIEIKLYP